MSVVFTGSGTPTMETCADKVNPLVLGGTNQLDRYLAQLDPAYIAVNEKSQEQWLTFTANMAECLNYYNAQNNIDGTWSAFFSQPLVSYARLSLQDTIAIQTYFSDLLAILQSPEEAAYTPQQRMDAFTTICFSIFTLCLFIDGQLASTSPDSDYNNSLSNLVANKLKQPLAKLISYYLGAGAFGIQGNLSTLVPPIPLFGAQVLTPSALCGVSLSSSAWFSPSPGFAAYLAGLNPDVSIFTNAFPPVPPDPSNPPLYAQQVWRSFLRASMHNLFTSIVNTFIYACTYIQQLNAQAFTTTLSNGQLPPHLCLYFTFLTMLEQSQNDLNGFTQRHLNFFYENVLQLGPLPAQPNQAHVTVQIAKNMPEYIIPAGSLFNAGKDDTGVNVSYSLLEGTVFNQATVAALQSFYIGGSSLNGDNYGTTIINNGKAFASPVANSIDGVGGAITTTPAAWQAFGNKSVSNTGDVTMLMPLANIGFAIASQYLYLQEGQRQIIIEMFTTNASLFTGLSSALLFSCQLTTPSTPTGWTTFGTTTPSIDISNGVIKFNITLDPKFPPVGAYSTKLNGPAIQTDLPVIQFMLIDNDFTNNGNFANLQFAQFSGCVISVTVGTNPNLNQPLTAASFNGLKTLYLSNDGGVINPAQPFSPFGSPAVAGRSINIGCRELFLKPDASYSVIVEHTELPNYTSPPLASGQNYPLWYPETALWFINGPIPNDQNSITQYNNDVPGSVPQASLEYLLDGTWTTVRPVYSYPLLSYPGTSPYGILASGPIPPLGGVNIDTVIGYDEPYGPFNQASTDGFMKVSLISDFGYDLYNAAIIQYRMDQSMAVAKAIATGAPETFTEFQPLQPYAPVIKAICINYTAQARIDFGQNLVSNNTAPYIHYFYIYPFGAVELTCPVPALTALTGGANLQLSNLSQYQPLTATSGAMIQVPIGDITWTTTGSSSPTVPQQWPPYIFPSFDGPAGRTAISFNSEFYIGLNNLVPGQNINLLFEVLDGSTNPLLGPVTGRQIFWFYLSNNQWVAFSPTSVIDATNQLTQSGIITYQVPLNATSQNTLLPAGPIWFKAGLTGFPDSVCQLISVLPQAALLQFIDNGNSPGFLQNQIPAGTITKLVKPLGPVKQIVQPFQSFGGQTAESTQAFWIRVSERLRHKDRAIQIWDYEHLILQQFTTIQKVKCLNHTEYNPPQVSAQPINSQQHNFNPIPPDGILYSEQSPGHVTIVTIPYVNNSNSANVLKPYTSVSVLEAINAFISTRISAQVTLHVENPIFEEILMDFSVQFMPGLDINYYSNLLNTAIVQFLSPWAFTDQTDISFGGIMYKSAIVNYIENLAYVSFITEVYMYSRASDSSQYSADEDTVIAANGISILVSAPQHTINVISNTNT